MKDPTAAWSALLRVHASLLPQLDQVLIRDHGIPLTWYDVLLELRAAPEGRLTMTELGRVAVVSRSRVSRVIDELVGAGLVRRLPNPQDGRSAYAELTRRGKAKLEKAGATYVAEIRRRFTAHLTTEQQSMITAGLGSVLAAQEVHSITPRSRGGGTVGS